MPEAGGSGAPSVTRYALGARGIDFIERTTAQGSTPAYPLYDGHGNMLATISLSGTLANQRHYDVWGAVRAEQDVDSINPRGQYVANLGHQTDVESSLVYMRARYYDAASGRFVTEDPARDGGNWFVYCNNDPVNLVDANGKSPLAENQYFANWFALGMLALGSAFILSVPSFGGPASAREIAIAAGLLVFASFAFAEALGETHYSNSRFLRFVRGANAFAGLFAALAIGLGYAKVASGLKSWLIRGAVAYDVVILGLLIGIDVNE